MGNSIPYRVRYWDWKGESQAARRRDYNIINSRDRVSCCQGKFNAISPCAVGSDVCGEWGRQGKAPKGSWEQPNHCRVKNSTESLSKVQKYPELNSALKNLFNYFTVMRVLSADALARPTGRSMTINLVFPETVLFYIREGQIYRRKGPAFSSTVPFSTPTPWITSVTLCMFSFTWNPFYWNKGEFVGSTAAQSRRWCKDLLCLSQAVITHELQWWLLNPSWMSGYQWSCQMCTATTEKEWKGRKDKTTTSPAPQVFFTRKLLVQLIPLTCICINTCSLTLAAKKFWQLLALIAEVTLHLSPLLSLKDLRSQSSMKFLPVHTSRHLGRASKAICLIIHMSAYRSRNAPISHFWNKGWHQEGEDFSSLAQPCKPVGAHRVPAASLRFGKQV